jgi:hypothetical protein
MLKIFTPIFMLLLLLFSLYILNERRTFDVSTLVHIDPLPHTRDLIAQEKYAEAEEYLSYFIAYDYVQKNPQNQQLLDAIKLKREDYGYKAKKFLEGLTKGKSDEDIGKASAIASDFLVIGDVRDLSIEGKHYIDNEKVDNVIVALSSLGLLATASTFYTLGATSPIKTSISVLKYGKKVNKLPSWLSEQLIKEAKISNKTKSVDNLKDLLQPIYKLYDKVGLNQTLNLLKSTRSLKELKSFVTLSTRFGKKSSILLKITKGKAFNYIKHMPKAKNENILYASTYGEKGLKGLSKLGENKFIKRVGFGSNLTKTTYKGNLDSFFNYLLKNIPNSLLYTISLLGFLYFIQKLSIPIKKLFHFSLLAK